MNPDVITAIGLICTALFIHAIFTSLRRLASIGYAILASVLVLVLGMVSMFFLVPSDASVAEVNKVLDMISGATTIGVLVAAVFGAHMPPRRVKDVVHDASRQNSQEPYIDSASGDSASGQHFIGTGRSMKSRIVALMGVALVVVALVVVAWGFGRWSAQVPAPPAGDISQSVALEVTPGPTQTPVVEEGTKSTALSPNIPDGVPGIAPYSAMGRTVERMIPDDTEPVNYREDWWQGLTPEQVTLYAEGLVRSGLEDLGLCKPGYTCHATLLYRVDEQSSSPYAVWLHMTLTTRTGHKELYYY